MKQKAAQATRAVVLLCALAVSGCFSRSTDQGKAKLFVLNPEEYLGTRLTLAGTVSHTVPAESFFILEDDTGKVVVSTHRTASKIDCPVGSRVAVEGALEKLEKKSQYYFAMERLIECKK